MSDASASIAEANTLLHDTVLAMQADFAAEALDLAGLHAGWASRWLQERQYNRAIIAFGAAVTAVRAAAEESARIRDKVEMAGRVSAVAREWPGKRGTA